MNLITYEGHPLIRYGEHCNMIRDTVCASWTVVKNFLEIWIIYYTRDHGSHQQGVFYLFFNIILYIALFS